MMVATAWFCINLYLVKIAHRQPAALAVCGAVTRTYSILIHCFVATASADWLDSSDLALSSQFARSTCLDRLWMAMYPLIQAE